MATSRYSLDITLPSGHTDGITALQFSPDGRFLASGSGDSVLLVFSTSTWKPVKQFVDASSVNTLVWHPVIPKTIISGYASGDVHTTRFESHKLADEGSKVWTDCMDGQVHRITIDTTGTKIAIAYGMEVAVLDQNTLSSWTNARHLPEPPSLPGLNEQLPTPTANSLHFINGGKVLIISYSDHGIVCWDTDSLGVKWHITPRACSICSVPIRIAKNVIIPVQFADEDNLLITGGTSGMAKVLDARTAETIQTLDHDSDDTIQAISFHLFAKKGARYVATGTSGRRSVIHIWVSKPEPVPESSADPSAESPPTAPPTPPEDPWVSRNQGIVLATFLVLSMIYHPVLNDMTLKAWHALLRSIAPFVRSVLEGMEDNGTGASTKRSEVV